jgi:hypothetical protein
MFDDIDGHLLDIFDPYTGTSKGAHLGTIRFPTGTSALIMDGTSLPVPGGDAVLCTVHQFQDKHTGTAKRLPLGISYVTGSATYKDMCTPVMQEPRLPLLPGPCRYRFRHLSTCNLPKNTR